MTKDLKSHSNHVHQPKEFNNAFIIASSTNALFVVFQIVFAYVTHSTSLLADAIHNLGDVLSLLLAWAATVMMKRQPTARSTYGMKKTTILAAFANGTLLIFTCGIIATEAMYKFFAPAEVQAVGVMIVAGIGVLINGATALLFIKGSDDLNIRGAFLHLVYDALVSVGVVISAALLYVTGWLWLDPLMGLLIAALILKGTWGLFSDSFRLIIDGVPRGISINKVHQFLSRQTGVESIHDLHVWALSTQENALSVHLLMPNLPMKDEDRLLLSRELMTRYNIHHTTIQVEQTSDHCDDACKPYL